MINIASTNDLYSSYREKMQEIADVKFSSAVLQWDQETYLPEKGAATRGRQIATLSEIAHRLFTDKGLGDLLNELVQRNDIDDRGKRNVVLTLEDYNKNKKYSPSFVREMSEQVNKTFYVWLEARKNNSFAVMQKELSRLVELKREETHILGYQHHPYDALLNEFEKGCTVVLVDKLFDDLKAPLKNLLDKIISKPQVDDAFLHQHFDKNAQWKLGLEVLELMGYDFKAGRQDISEHPFTINFNSKDVRVTTRIDEMDFTSMLWSCIHEGGHALYEQGLPEEEYGLPLGEACSFSIHESQSRLWENCIGRSHEFCGALLPRLKNHFPEQLNRVTDKEFYKAINKVQPSLIRTEADELTYHFHIMIRYELEKGLLDGSLETHDIPAYWNEKYSENLDVTVPDDKQGCLQDIHWSHGSFGYFPTYSLGSFYAVQLFESARTAIQGLADDVSTLSFNRLLIWLQQCVYQHGRYYTSEELCNKYTGRPLDSSYFVEYLSRKYAAIYP
ncbi:MAG: carboxypeptidase M32 [Chitinophagaceae bacterium]|nr:carboxypeptidase M32 [Chitinophagaceae bacterium]